MEYEYKGATIMDKVYVWSIFNVLIYISLKKCKTSFFYGCF